MILKLGVKLIKQSPKVLQGEKDVTFALYIPKNILALGYSIIKYKIKINMFISK